jgi:putative RNA 2'-phosphotransferase
MGRTSDERLGRLLAFVLRHRPDAAGLVLDSNGWADVDELVAGLRRMGRRVGAADVRRVADADAKARYQIRGSRIRAAQGHSVEVDLGLRPRRPPGVLYHGTVERRLASIMASGAPVVLVVDAAALHAGGHEFRQASNGVWLTDTVPPEHLRRL